MNSLLEELRRPNKKQPTYRSTRLGMHYTVTQVPQQVNVSPLRAKSRSGAWECFHGRSAFTGTENGAPSRTGCVVNGQ